MSTPPQGSGGTPGWGDPWTVPAGPSSWMPAAPQPAPARSPVGPWVLAAVLLLLATLAAAFGAYGLHMQQWMDRHAVLVSATVVSVDTTLDYVDVTFEVGGEPQDAEVAWYGLHPRVGDPVDVEYDPEDPTYARRPHGTEDRDVGVAFLAGGGVLLVAGGGCTTWAVRRQRRRRS